MYVYVYNFIRQTVFIMNKYHGYSYHLIDSGPASFTLVSVITDAWRNAMQYSCKMNAYCIHYLFIHNNHNNGYLVGGLLRNSSVVPVY